MKIFLTGFMGSGKSTVGRVLAQQLGWPFVDLDFEIEKRTSREISTIFKQTGEPAFRKEEREALYRLDMDPAIVATGGGCFVNNRDWMLSNGLVIYLQVPFDVLISRVGADPARPLWRNAESIFLERQQAYSRAHLSVNAAATPEEVAVEIVRLSEEKRLASLTRP